MIPRSLSRFDVLLVAALVLAVGLYAGSVVTTGSFLPRTTSAYAQDVEPLSVTSAAAEIGGNEVGEVMVGGEVVLRIRTAAGGYSAPDRSDIVADRLRTLILGDLDPGQVHAGQMRGMAAVLANGNLIITADEAHARMNNTSPNELAMTWADNIAAALGGAPGEAEFEQKAEPPAPEWEPSEPYEDKDVPILSAGRGLRLGMARVSGPASKVSQVQGVAQLEANLKDFGDVVIYVPISTKIPGKDLDRVNECAVVGLADIGL